jgi:carbonic anhydrase
VVQFAVDVLKVEHILVVGHYGCGGVHASMTGNRVGLADNWLRHVGDVAYKHSALLNAIELEALRHATLCELNVIEQVQNLCQTTIMEDAWARGQQVSVHGWVYSLLDGRVRELGMDVSGSGELDEIYERALARAGRQLARETE